VTSCGRAETFWRNQPPSILSVKACAVCENKVMDVAVRGMERGLSVCQQVGGGVVMHFDCCKGRKVLALVFMFVLLHCR